MKLRMKRKAMVILAAGMLMSAAAPAAAMAAEKATGPALTASYNGDVNTLEAAKDATQLIVVIGNRQDPAKSRLDWYKRDADGKLVQVMSKEAVSGMNGITMQKQEGDKKTPAGVYRFTMAFGLKANPGTILICIALVAVVALILYSLIRQHKQGKSSCGCNCAHCAMHGSCHSCK